MAVELPYPLILASGSARRRGLLAEWGYDFAVVTPEFSEPAAPMGEALSPAGWVEALAYLKAYRVAEAYPEGIVVGADTVVVHDEEVIGKPKDQVDARRILTTQFAGPNEVITGVAVLYPPDRQIILTHVVTTILMRAMTTAELEAYMASGAWEGKAGAYALQEGGDKFVISLDGSESNVVGLPMEKLEEIFNQITENEI
jgi:nucleoside triphosphate pyrophosphatase